MSFYNEEMGETDETDEKSLIWALSKVLDKTSNIELSKNEKLFLFSLGFSSYHFFNGNTISFSIDPLSDESNAYTYLINSTNDDIKYLIELYNILGEKIAIGNILKEITEKRIETFDYTKDVLKIFYREYLTEDEKIHIISLLNLVAKNLLSNSRTIDNIRKNIDELVKFFNLMYTITDGMFRYDEKIASALISINKYAQKKAFFNSLIDIINQLQSTKFKTPEMRLEFVQNINDILSKESEDFRQALAKTIIK